MASRADKRAGRVETVPLSKVRFSQWTVSDVFSRRGGSIRDFDERKLVPPFGVRLGSGDVLVRDNRRVVAAKLAGCDRIPVLVHEPRDRLEPEYGERSIVSFAWTGSVDGCEGVFRVWAGSRTALTHVAMRCATQRGGPDGGDFPLDGYEGTPVIVASADATSRGSTTSALRPVDLFVFDFAKRDGRMKTLPPDGAVSAVRAEADGGRPVFVCDGDKRQRLYMRRGDTRQLLAAHGDELRVSLFAFVPGMKILEASADEPPEYDLDDPDVLGIGLGDLIEQDDELDDLIDQLEEERWGMVRDECSDRAWDE